jgi:hypothetical protein
MGRFLISIVLGVAACAPCGEYATVEVVGATDDQRTLIENTLDRFSRWSGRDEVCVTTVEVLDALEEEGRAKLGGFQSAQRLIQLDAAQPDLERTLIHELCHVVDWEERLTWRHPELFPYDPEAFDFALRDEKSRHRESFAVTCENGPEPLQAATQIALECDDHPAATALGFVDDNVFGAAVERAFAHSELFDLQLEMGSGKVVDGRCLEQGATAR